MIVGVPKEITPGERRVALVPDSVAQLTNMGLKVSIQSGAGTQAMFSDDQYLNAGATIEPEPESLYHSADVVLKVRQPSIVEVDSLRENSALVCFLQSLTNTTLVQCLASRGLSVFSMDAVPRIAKAQSMDALSSMASIAGYKAALIAADSIPKYFPMMITAAGTTPPAKGLVIGAGVAGLQSIATARRLGAVMYGFDVRPAVKEQVESLGANFVSLGIEATAAESSGGYAKEIDEETRNKEHQILHSHVKDMDFVISTAAVPGKPAPLLITADMVRDMRSGSVIVDIAAETGGNCELTSPGEIIVENGVIVTGPLNLPSSMPLHASQMYSRNISNLLIHIIIDDGVQVDLDDEITQNCCIVNKGVVLANLD